MYEDCTNIKFNIYEIISVEKVLLLTCKNIFQLIKYVKNF